MNFDKNLQFCCEQAITGAATSENVIELGTNDISIGSPIPLCTIVTEGFNNITNMKIALQTCENADFSGTINTIDERTFLLSELKAGAILPPKYLPAGAKGYARLSFTPTGTVATSGKITSGVVDAHHEDYTNL